jgi:hypothetical protein
LSFGEKNISERAAMKVLESPNGYLRLRSHLLRNIYRKNPYYRDSTTPLLKMLLDSSSCFYGLTEQIPLVVTDHDETPLATAVIIIARKMPDILQVGFFEALSDQQEAVSMLLERTREIAASKPVRRIIIGLNGHINNGLGFLADSHKTHPCFGSGYNPPYYIDYLEQYATSTETLVSYLYHRSAVNIDKDKKLIERISRRFKVRTADFGNLKKEIGIYTQLNNECFRNHPLYYERSQDEDYELFKSFSPLLKEENFLVSEREGKPIGFLLWYPDFHELVKPGRKLGLATAIKYRLPGNPISKLKIAEIGILPEYQGSAAIGGLIGRCFEIGKKNGYSCCESGWIFDINAKSKGISERWTGDPHKAYKVFEIDMEKVG